MKHNCHSEKRTKITTFTFQEKKSNKEVKKHRRGINCKQCGEILFGVFAYAGKNSTLKKIQGFGYCRSCEELFKVKLEVV